jgi:hypothetical protein
LVFGFFQFGFFLFSKTLDQPNIASSRERRVHGGQRHPISDEVWFFVGVASSHESHRGKMPLPREKVKFYSKAHLKPMFLPAWLRSWRAATNNRG